MYRSAKALSNAIKHRDVSCQETMQWTLDRIDELNPAHNAIVSMPPTPVLIDAAKTADQQLAKGVYRGWLHGMPHAVKDLAQLNGFVTSMGSPVFSNAIATEDELCIERIRAAGAIFIGKTNVPEFGLGSQSYNSVFGATGNAFDSTLTAGGSSGGAAAALALGLLPVADGSDMMGSLRNPAAFNNVIGFRPSLGRVPKSSPELFYSQLATEGPMARTMTDLIHLFTTMAGPDPRAPLSHHAPLPDPMNFKPAKISELKIGWLGNYNGYLPMEAGVLELCESTLNQYQKSGGHVAQVNIDFDMHSLWQCWLTLRHWTLGKYHTLYANEVNRAQLKPELIWEIEQGFGLSASEITLAASIRSSWYRAVNKAFESSDILALPSAQVFPFSIETHWPAAIDGKPMDTYHRWMEVVISASLCGCPVISLPAGFEPSSGKTRAMGIQFMAPMGKDKELLEFALAFEDVCNWHDAYQFGD